MGETWTQTPESLGFEHMAWMYALQYATNLAPFDYVECLIDWLTVKHCLLIGNV